MLEDERQGGSATGEYAENALIRERYFILSFKLVFFTNVSNNCEEQKNPLNCRLYKKIQKKFRKQLLKSKKQLFGILVKKHFPAF